MSFSLKCPVDYSLIKRIVLRPAGVSARLLLVAGRGEGQGMAGERGVGIYFGPH